MPRNPLLENMLNDQPSLGGWASDSGMIRLMAEIGFDWVMLDMMFSEVDWSKLDILITTCEAAGITPVVRVQSNPWIGYDHRIAVDVTRAQGVGAQFVVASVSGKKEAEECFEVSRDWHRRPITVHPFSDYAEWESKIGKLSQETYFAPSVESKRGIEETEDILAIPGLKSFRVAMTDASRVLTNSDNPDWYHAKLWEYLAKVVKIGREKNIIIQANTSYAYNQDEMLKRVKKLSEAGVNMVLMQSALFLFQISVGKFITSIRKEL
jgi:2-keto-3-deoxy-L-rhamnonate aldolase RhmA